MTAYEMRISDWSSDVCSSDLVRAAGGLTEDVRQRHDADVASQDRHGGVRDGETVLGARRRERRGDRDARAVVQHEERARGDLGGVAASGGCREAAYDVEFWCRHRDGGLGSQIGHVPSL